MEMPFYVDFRALWTKAGASCCKDLDLPARAFILGASERELQLIVNTVCFFKQLCAGFIAMSSCVYLKLRKINNCKMTAMEQTELCLSVRSHESLQLTDSDVWEK